MTNDGLQRTTQASEAMLLAFDLMKTHGIKETWTFKFDGAKGRGGLCNHGKRFISLSRHFVEAATIAEVRNTLLHEIAHALVGPGHGHGRVWKQKAREIGCTAERCHSVKMPDKHYNYAATCSACDFTYQRIRLRANVRNHSACAKCWQAPKLLWRKL